MSAINIIGKTQRVVDAPGLSIDELAGKLQKCFIKIVTNVNLKFLFR